MLSTISEAPAGDETGITAKMELGLENRMHDAILQAVHEIFEGYVLPQAQRDSPVGTPPDDRHPGKNRASIHTRVFDDREKHQVTGTVYTTSGYGWLLEHGTTHNRAITRLGIRRRHGQQTTADRTPATPYIYPAVRDNIPLIIEQAKAIMEGAA